MTARSFVLATLVFLLGAATGAGVVAGPTILYVLEGEVTAETPDGTRTYKAGDVMWHPARRSHTVKNAAPHPARALAVHLDPL